MSIPTLSRIIILQKKIMIVISIEAIFDSYNGVLLKELKILKFSDIYLYQIGKFMYLFKRGLLPNYFLDMFTLASQIHLHITQEIPAFSISSSLSN